MTTVEYVEADLQRLSRLQFGELVYQAKFDHEKLKCYYNIITFPCCCATDEYARMTTLDVTTTAMYVFKPEILPLCLGVLNRCTCCCPEPNGSFAFFSSRMFDNAAIKGECCGPYPFCCTDRVPCGCCCFDVGETILFMGSGSPTRIGHGTCGMFPNWCALIACCRPFDIMFGLQNGEAQRLAIIVNNLKNEYRKDPTNAARCRLLNAPRPGSPMGGGGGGVSVNVHHHHHAAPPPPPGGEYYAPQTAAPPPAAHKETSEIAEPLV